MNIIRYGAGTRTVTLAGVTYDLLSSDKAATKLVRSAVVRSWKRKQKRAS